MRHVSWNSGVVKYTPDYLKKDVTKSKSDPFMLQMRKNLVVAGVVGVIGAFEYSDQFKNTFCSN